MNNKILALQQTIEIIIQRALSDGIPEAVIMLVLQNKLNDSEKLVNQALQKEHEEANKAKEVGEPVTEDIQHPEDSVTKEDDPKNDD